MKKNKKRKERMAAATTYTNPMNQKHESPKTLKRQREEDDFVNGKKDKVKQVDSPQKKCKEKREAKGKETPKSPSQRSPSKSQKSPDKVNGSKTANTIHSMNGDSKPTKIMLADLFSESDRLLPGSKRNEMTKSYTSSKPYKHIVIPNVMNPDLLSRVRDEILTHLHFTPKQTDIYTVSQTGDLANLTGLPTDELASLPSLLTLRNALYSPSFRAFLCAVTGVSALSGTKTDMSINSYLKGGHLLTHDDVIGTRCVSFILYLVNADGVDGGWKEEWGGGLRLYETSVDGVPENQPCLTIPPQWNQMSMFGKRPPSGESDGVAVQPGKSFHDVEEVYTAEHPRLAISGWFHVPQPGEEGYQPPSSTAEKSLSSLEQLTTLADDKIWSFAPTTDLPDYDFTAEDFEFLGQWINEVYLTPDIVEQMSEAMQDESVLELPDFLAADVATKVHAHLTAKDRPPYQDEDWAVAGPPHKHRFRYSQDGVFPGLAQLFQHPAFQKWLFHVTGLEVSSHRSLARHFRPGNDYTLATEHKCPTPNLEATLSLTPSALRPKPPKKIGISAKAMFAAKETGWTTGEFGGYEVYLAPGDDEDPAVYKSSEGGDDGVLFSSDAAWNSLSLVLRDEGVLKFVKYVSKAAFGGRWDVTSEWTVKKSDDDEEENEEDGEENGDDEEEWTGIPE